jgi:DNA-binding LytR/AlgR family response regulator
MKTNYDTNTDNLVRVGGHKRFNPSIIVMMEADINYTKVHLNSGKIIYVATNLKKLEERLATNVSFFRSHRSFIINLNHVINNCGEDTIELANNRIVSVARRRKEALVQKLAFLRMAV